MSQKIAVVCQNRKRTVDIITELVKEFNSPVNHVTRSIGTIRIGFLDGSEIIWVNRVDKACGRLFTRAIIDITDCRDDFYEIVDEVQYRVRPEYGGSKV